jgi:hypothetical protein
MELNLYNQILRMIFDSINIDNIWRIRSNIEIDKLIRVQIQ